MSKLKVSAIHDPDNDNEAITVDTSGNVSVSSNLKVNTIQDTTGNNALTIDSFGNVTASQGFVPSTQLSHRNLIINGAMQVAQRGTSVTGVTGGGYRTCDRMYSSFSSLGTWTVDQSTDAPNGFSNSFKVTTTTADTSPGTGDYASVSYWVEAQDLQCLGYGTSGAKTSVISFWVKSNKTGDASFNVRQLDNSNKNFSSAYTINLADTWEQKTIVIPADTSGVINNDNGGGFALEWFINSGSNYTSGSHSSTYTTFSNTNRNPSNLGVGGATSDYFAITGIQLEVGSVATPFEHRSYGEELARCQRYFERITETNTDESLIGLGYIHNSTRILARLEFMVEKRVSPSGSYSNLSHIEALNSAGWQAPTSIVFRFNTRGGRMDMDGLSSLTPQGCAEIRFNTAASGQYIDADAEL